MHKPNLKLLISEMQIKEKIREVAALLNKEYAGKELTIVMVMKGAFCLTADLIRHLTLSLRVEYIRASSYGPRGTTPGELVIRGVDEVDVKNRHVLVIDDIFDSGQTMQGITQELKTQHPSSIKSLVLLLKESNLPKPDYYLFTIKDEFVVGYGLDYKEQYRQLPDIYAFEESTFC